MAFANILTAVAFMARSIATRLIKHRVIDATDIEKIAQLVNDAASHTRDLSVPCTGWMSTQPGWSSRCKIWWTGKSGEHPAAYR